MPQSSVPWWDAGTCKAYKKGPTGPEEALSIVEGPEGNALAVFITGSPQKLPGLTNETWRELKGAPERVKRKSCDAKDAPATKVNH